MLAPKLEAFLGLEPCQRAMPSLHAVRWCKMSGVHPGRFPFQMLVPPLAFGASAVLIQFRPHAKHCAGSRYSAQRLPRTTLGSQNSMHLITQTQNRTIAQRLEHNIVRICGYIELIQGDDEVGIAVCDIV